MYISIAKITHRYYGSCGLTENNSLMEFRAETIDELYEKMARYMCAVDEDNDPGSPEGTFVQFGEIIPVTNAIRFDPKRLEQTHARREYLARIAAQKAAEEAEEARLQRETEEAIRAANTIYIASYADPMYPEDNRIIGAYTTEEAAKKAIESECSYYEQKNPQAHKANPMYYDITEETLAD